MGSVTVTVAASMNCVKLIFTFVPSRMLTG